jgi:hypothetical protein
MEGVMKVWKCSQCKSPCLATIIKMDGETTSPVGCLDGIDDEDWQETDEYELVENKKEEHIMKFQDAAQIMDFGDQFKFGGEILTMVRHEDDNDMKAFVSDLHEEYVIIEPELLIKEGQIIKAGPNVLSAEDIQKNIAERWQVGGNQYVYEIELVQAGHQNGRLERDLELRPLFEVIEFAIKEATTFSHHTNKIVNAFKNLKPLEKA